MIFILRRGLVAAYIDGNIIACAGYQEFLVLVLTYYLLLFWFRHVMDIQVCT